MVAGAWEELLEVERTVQRHFPECVLVGGTAAALHAQHRVSWDVDSVLTDLRERFPSVLAKLEALAGWKTARLMPPVLILENFQGVEVGIRQLRRAAPLETTTIQGVVVPTLGEMVRIKRWLVATRNAVRDYLDLAALADRCGTEAAAHLAPLDRLYPQPAPQASPLQQLLKQLAEPKPYDFDATAETLDGWRELQPRWTNWAHVTSCLQALAVKVLEDCTGGSA